MSTIAHQPRGIYCLDCGYCLEQLPSNRCPECGREFDPDDPATTSAIGRWRRVEQWSLTPSRILRPATTVGVTLALIASVLLTGSRAMSWLALCIMFAAIAVVYLPKRWLRWMTVVRHGMPRELLLVDRAAIRRGRRAFLLAAAVNFLRLPFWTVFFASYPWLQRSAVYEYEVASVLSARPSNTFVGAFPVRRVYVEYRGVEYDIIGGGALFYLENPELGYPQVEFRHIFGNWYAAYHTNVEFFDTPFWVW